MQEQTKIEETLENIRDYVDTNIELVKLKGSDKLAHIGSNLMSQILIVFIVMLSIIILSFALSFYLNIKLLSQYYGFLVVGGGYFVIAFFLLCVRKKYIAKPFRNKIIKELFKNNNL